MKASIAAVVSFIALAVGGYAAVRATATEQQLHDLSARVQSVELTKPGIREVMGQVYTHYNDLGAAVEQGNWGLAQYKLMQLEEFMNTVPTLRPIENGLKLSDVTGAFVKGPLAGMYAAVKTQNKADFMSGYRGAAMTCNGCHAATGRVYIQIMPAVKAP